MPGTPVPREFEYRRNGTAVLVAGLNVHDGEVAGWVTDSTRSENFVAFLADLTNKRRSAWSCTASVDNISAHVTPGVECLFGRPLPGVPVQHADP